MATVSNPLIGSTSGSVGGVTFSKWKGINVIKSKPTVVADPKSDKQKAQRAAFAFMVTIYRLMVAVIVLGFKEMAIKKSAFNAFTSVNLKNAFDYSAPPAATLIPANLLISKGTISNTAIADADFDFVAHTATLAFADTAALPGQSLSDKPIFAAFNEYSEEWISGVGETTRETGELVINMPASWIAGNRLHFYLGFVNADGSASSDSAHISNMV